MEELRTGLDSALISKLSDFFWQELKLVFEPWVVLVLWFHLLQLVGKLSLDIYIILPMKIAGAEENTGGRKPEVSVARLSLPG